MVPLLQKLYWKFIVSELTGAHSKVDAHLKVMMILLVVSTLRRLHDGFIGNCPGRPLSMASSGEKTTYMPQNGPFFQLKVSHSVTIQLHLKNYW